MDRKLILTIVLVFAVLLAACGSASTPAATTAPTTGPAEPTAAGATAATDTSVPVATDTPVPAAEGDAENGAMLFVQNGCSGCHGPQAGGGAGPTLAGRGIDLERVLRAVRSGPGGMPAFDAGQVSDGDVQDLVAWLSSL